MSVHEVTLPGASKGRVRWEVRYREGRRNRSKRFTAERDAERFDAEQRRKRERGEPIIRARDTPYLKPFTADWLEQRKAEGVARNTLRFNAATYNKHLGPYVGDQRVADLTPVRLEEWRAELLEAGVSPYMFNRALELMGQLLAAARRRGYVSINGARDLERLKRRARTGKTAPPEQIEAIRDHFLESSQLGDATLISVLAYVGLRPDEARKVRWDNLEGRRFLLEPEQTKTGVRRHPEIPAPVLADLAQWRLACGSPEGLIFPRANGHPWSKTARDNWRNRVFRPAAGAAGLLEWDEDAERWVGDFRPYDLRHTCASLMIRSHTPPAEVAAHMGHSLAVLSGTYAHAIEAMRDRPAEPMAAAISSARRGGDVRSTFGEAAG